jgi:hypothetical protein
MICILRGYVATAIIQGMLSFISEKMKIKTHTGGDTYYVPATVLVLASVSFPPKLLARPKSEIFGFSSSSNKILLAFRSL